MKLRPGDSSHRITPAAAVGAVALPLFVASCVYDFVGSPKQPPDTPRTASVQVLPNSATITSIGTPVTLRAVYRDVDGTEIPGQPIAWASLNPALAAVDSATGAVTALASGQVTIEAFVGGTPGYALITIAPPGAPPIGSLVALQLVPGEPLNALWGANDTDVYAASAGGSLHHFDGSSWSVTAATPNHEALQGLWGTSGSDVFAVGEHGVILHNGVPQPETDVQPLAGVWGSSPRDVFAVGAGGTIEHYDGSQWTRMTSGVTQNLRSVWGTSSTNVYAVGDGGVILRFDGEAWWQQSSGVATILLAVWGTSPNDVYAVGSNGTVLHFDGARWTPVSLGSDATFYTVWGTSTSDVYIAGPPGLLFQFDGVSWTGLPVDSVTARAAWGTLAGDLLVARDDGTLLQGHRGGGTRLVFARIPTSTVAGVPLDTVEVWVVDGSGQRVADASDSISITVHSGPDSSLFSGTTTVQADSGRARFNDLRFAVAAPVYTLEATTSGLGSAESPSFTVSAGAARRLLFVNTPIDAVAGQPFSPALAVAVADSFGNRVHGYTTSVGIGVLPIGSALYGTTSQSTVDGLATFPDLSIRIAGGGYTLIAVVQGLIADTSPQFSVTPGRVAHVSVLPGGATITAPGETVTFQVASVMDQYHNPILGQPVSWTSLNQAVALVEAATGVATAVGFGQATIAAQVDTAFGYGLVTVAIPGQTAVTVWDSVASGTTQHLYAVSGTSASNVWVVGDSGTILYFNGTRWSRSESGTTTPLYGVWAASTQEAFAVGGNVSEHAVILRHGANRWERMVNIDTAHVPPGAANARFGVWGASPSDVYAVGLTGNALRHMLHFNGFQWLDENAAFLDLYAVWGASATDVYAVGDVGILYGERGSWAGFSTGFLFGVWGTSPNDVFAVGPQEIYYFDGSAWSSQFTGTESFGAVGGSSPSDVYAVGDGGVILRYDGSAWTAQPSPTTQNLNGIWVAPTGEVFVVGDGGLILRGRR